MVARRLLAAIVLALGLLAGTAVSAMLSDSGWLVMAGPVLVACAIVGACAVEQWQREGGRARMWAAVGVGAIYIAATVIVGWSDPASVVNVVPLLGAGGIVVLGGADSNERACARGKREA